MPKKPATPKEGEKEAVAKAPKAAAPEVAPPVSFGFGLGWPGEDRRNGRGKDLASLLGFRSENHPPEPAQGGRLLFQRRHDPLQGPQQGFQIERASCRERV